MPNRRSRVDAAEIGDSEGGASIVLVARDFAALAEVFAQQLELVPPSDEETRAHIRKAKAAAERGMHLSKQLLARIRPESTTSK
jgi:hypothetical protein